MKLYVKINSGAAGLVWVVGFFALVACVHLSKSIAAQATMLVTGWTAGLGAILLKNNANNKLDLEAAKVGNGTVEALNKVKMNAGAPCA